jgi:preprotein translocase subunit YajC
LHVSPIANIWNISGTTSLLSVFQAGGTSGLLGLLPLVFIFGVFYLLLIRPQQTKQKKWAAVLETLKPGDKVTTSGGMRGTILSIKDDAFIVRVAPDNLKFEIVKSAVVGASTGTEEKQA